MIKVDSTLTFLKKNKEPQKFEEIFKAVKDKLPESLLENGDDQAKAELWNALIGSIEIVRVGEQEFDLSSRYSIAELNRIEKLNHGVEEIEREED